MDPPIEPMLEDCCNSGCNPCIFDIYERQLKLYKSGLESSTENKENGILELKYTPFIIVSAELLCHTMKKLCFKRCNQAKTKVWWSPGDHFLYKYNSSTLSCTRAYTPIKLNSDKKEDYDFSIVVKCYDDGQVSKHLFKLEEGEVTLWRGPYGSYKLQPNTFSKIIMIAQGTGIAPFITIIERILGNEEDMTKVILCYCCRSIEEVLFRDELLSYRSYWNFSYKIFLTCFTNNINIKYQEPIITRKFSYADLYQLEPSSNDQFLICGSLTFMQVYNNAIREKLQLVDNILLF